MKNVIKICFTFFLLIIITFTLSGCPKKDSATETKKDTEKKEVKKDAPSTGQKKILMLGRSVMNGWFDYWGYDYESPVNKDDCSLEYKELSTPPEIATSAIEYVNEADDDTIVYFKFCFDDFWASSSDEVKENLEENKKYVNQVVDEVVDNRSMKLIIGNALPKVSQYTDESLVSLQTQYNDWLEELADENEGSVYIFDQYSILADNNGSLKSDYAVSADDSHLNNSAYEALDNSFFEFVKENF